MKRFFDLALALLLLVPALLVSVIFILVIAAESPGSPIFRQIRVGRNGEEFTLFKLRTMFAGTSDMASHEASASRITPAGRLIRRLKIDELPQVLNVLRGNMSFIGPRPCLPTQLEIIAERKSRQVLSLCPGITGLAQIAGIDMSTPAELAIADAGYLMPWSLRRDIAILIRTVFNRHGDAVTRGDFGTISYTPDEPS